MNAHYENVKIEFLQINARVREFIRSSQTKNQAILSMPEASLKRDETSEHVSEA